MSHPVRLYMSMSLGEFVAGPDDRPGQELGRDGGRLFDHLGGERTELEPVRRLTGDGSRLVVLKFPEETAASLELVHRPADGPVDVGSGVDHLAIQVDGLAGTDTPTG